MHACSYPEAVHIITADSPLVRDNQSVCLLIPRAVFIITADSLLVGSQSERALAYIQGLSSRNCLYIIIACLIACSLEYGLEGRSIRFTQLPQCNTSCWTYKFLGIDSLKISTCSKYRPLKVSTLPRCRAPHSIFHPATDKKPCSRWTPRHRSRAQCLTTKCESRDKRAQFVFRGE